MKFSPADQVNGNTINGYDPGTVVVNGNRHNHSLIVLPDQLITEWRPGCYFELQQEDLQELLQLNPEVVLLGTGPRQEFPAPSLLALFLEQQIGIETMDTASACRTYNILAAEGRRVAAALLLK
jgi:uncharacterized protein